MEVKFYVNDYILIWNLLFQASISEQIYKIKQKLWTNYKEEYNITYRDKSLILKDAKNFIPNDDTIYNILLETREYEKLKKSSEKYRIEIMKIWDANKRLIHAFTKNVLRKEIKPYTVLVINEELNIIDVSKENATIIIGKKIDKKNPMRIIVDIVMAILKSEINFNKDQKEITSVILELAIENELATILTKKSCYLKGDKAHVKQKENIYPYWLMYLAVPKAEFITYIARDKIVFDATNILYKKELQKMNISEFIDFCITNKNQLQESNKQEIL